jgi:hypothetical protein
MQLDRDLAEVHFVGDLFVEQSSQHIRFVSPPQREMSVKAMKAGSMDFFPKALREQDMLDAVTRALRLDDERLAFESSIAIFKNIVLFGRQRWSSSCISSISHANRAHGDRFSDEFSLSSSHHLTRMPTRRVKTVSDASRLCEHALHKHSRGYRPPFIIKRCSAGQAR